MLDPDAYMQHGCFSLNIFIVNQYNKGLNTSFSNFRGPLLTNTKCTM